MRWPIVIIPSKHYRVVVEFSLILKPCQTCISNNEQSSAFGPTHEGYAGMYVFAEEMMTAHSPETVFWGTLSEILSLTMCWANMQFIINLSMM